MKLIEKVILLLIVLNIIISGVIFYSEYSNTEICLTGKSCSAVTSSAYAKIFSIPLANIGISAFLLLLLVYLLVLTKKLPRWFFLISTYLGFVFAIYFLCLQFFVIKAVCSNCLAVDTIMILISVLATIDFLNKRR